MTSFRYVPYVACVALAVNAALDVGYIPSYAVNVTSVSAVMNDENLRQS